MFKVISPIVKPVTSSENVKVAVKAVLVGSLTELDIITVGAVTSLTKRLKVQLSTLEAASVAVNVIVWLPKPTTVPGAGLWVTVGLGSQLSVTAAIAR